jgi:hypothetical protein
VNSDPGLLLLNTTSIRPEKIAWCNKSMLFLYNPPVVGGRISLLVLYIYHSRCVQGFVLHPLEALTTLEKSQLLYRGVYLGNTYI